MIFHQQNNDIFNDIFMILFMVCLNDIFEREFLMFFHHEKQSCFASTFF